MAEAFSNSLTRAVGIVTTATEGAIGVTTNLITGISTNLIAVGDIIDNQNYIAGTKVNSTTCDRDSTNTAASSSQSINYLGVTTVYTSTAKSILIGGTFANNTGSQVNLTVALYDDSNSRQVAIASKVPVPNGSSFVISDAGKTVLEANDEIRAYCDTANAVDITLNVLTGVS